MSDVCGGCKQPLVTGRVIRALDRRWHKDCFKCGECKQPIVDPVFTELKRQPLCTKCAEKKGGIHENDPCGVCGAKLGLESVEHPLSGKSVHAGCLKCAVCNKLLEAQVVVKDKELCHPGCAQQSLAKPCVVCGKALEGTTFTVEGRSYHELCYAEWSKQARKVQALVRGHLERKGVALEKSFANTPVTDSSITPARARRLSGLGNPPVLQAKTPTLPPVPEDGSVGKSSVKATPPPPPSSGATTLNNAATANAAPPPPRGRSPSPASRAAPPPPSPQPTQAATATATTPAKSPSSTQPNTPAATTAAATTTPKLTPSSPPPPPPSSSASSPQTMSAEEKKEADEKTESERKLDVIRQKEIEAKAKRQKTKDEHWGTEAQIEEEEVYEEPPLPTNVQDLKHELSHCGGLLSSVDADWGLRVRALHRIEALVKFVSLPMPESVAADPQTWEEQIKLFQPFFAVQVNELRSSIVRETCRLLIALSKSLGQGMVECVAALLPNLIANTYVTVKVIRESSVTCTTELLTRVPSVSYLAPLLILINDSHAPARASATKHIGDVIKGDEAVSSGEHKEALDQVLSIVPKVFEDKDPEVRKNSIFLFTEYKKRFPEKAEALLPTLSARAQKALGVGAVTPKEGIAAKRAPFRPPVKAKPSDEKVAEEAT